MVLYAMCNYFQESMKFSGERGRPLTSTTQPSNFQTCQTVKSADAQTPHWLEPCGHPPKVRSKTYGALTTDLVQTALQLLAGPSNATQSLRHVAAPRSFALTTKARGAKYYL